MHTRAASPPGISSMSPIAMTALLAAGLAAFAYTALRRWRLLRVARAPAARFSDVRRRIDGVLRYMFGQQRMFRYRAAGVAHAFIFAGFVILLIRTLILFARGYTGPGFGFGLFDEGTWLGDVYSLAKDLVGVLVIIGVVYFLYQRLVVRPRRMELSGEGLLILCLILGLIVADLCYEASGFVRSGRPAAERMIAPAAALVSLAIEPASAPVRDNLYYLGFWLHSAIVLLFLNLLPYGKHFHVLTVLPNVYFRNLDGIGRLRPVADIEGKLEREEPLGARTVRELSWKDVLDFYTCTECGRCSDHCPAFNTGKLLSPKHLTMQLRDYMLDRQDRWLAAAPPLPADADAHSAAPECAAKDADELLTPVAVEPEMLWACTTCGACEQECPVFISYVDKIVDLRRNLVMERGEFPDQLQNAFRGLESVGNPYSFDNSQRAAWAEGLGVPLRSEKPDAQYLFWVGCAPSFDDRSRKIARATARLFQIAGLDFAILGPEETCNGDPARRAGNEYLFQTLARQNVEALNQHGVRKIVTTCPHCFNVLANEYPEFGGRYEVIHHTELLARLVREGRLLPTRRLDGTVVFHDSCYLGRYNDVYDAPRELLAAIPGLRVVEAAESRDRGMCCGAGGAQMWKEDEPTRRPGSREGDGKVNHARVRQLLRVLPGGVRAESANPSAAGAEPDHAGVARGPQRIATACPFCKTMISDGLTDQGHEHVDQADVAEFLLRAVEV